MIFNTQIIAAAIAAAIAGPAGFTAAWKWQAGNITTMRAEYAQTTMDAERTAFTRSERNSATVIAAQRNAAVRVRTHSADAAAAVSSGNGLRVASQSAASAASESLTACTALNTRFDTVLDAAISEAQRLAEAADAWQSDAMMITEAWPK